MTEFDCLTEFDCRGGCANLSVCSIAQSRVHYCRVLTTPVMLDPSIR